MKVGKQKPKKKQKEDLKKHSEEDNVITPVNKGTEVKKRDLSLTIVNEVETVKGGITASSKPPVFENVCEAYKKKQCPHGYSGTKLVDGVACSKKHPPMCGYFTSHGTTRRVECRKGKDCHKYHPPICRNSEIKRECLNEGCDLIHLKNTRRKPGILRSRTTQEQQQKPRKEEKRRTWSDVVQNRNRRLQGSQSSAT